MNNIQTNIEIGEYANTSHRNKERSSKIPNCIVTLLMFSIAACMKLARHWPGTIYLAEAYCNYSMPIFMTIGLFTRVIAAASAEDLLCDFNTIVIGFVLTYLFFWRQ